MQKLQTICEYFMTILIPAKIITQILFIFSSAAFVQISLTNNWQTLHE